MQGWSVLYSSSAAKPPSLPSTTLQSGDFGSETNSMHWFTMSFLLGRRVPESEAWRLDTVTVRCAAKMNTRIEIP